MWTQYRSKLRQMKVAQAKAAQKLLSTPKKSASDGRVSEGSTVSKTNLKAEVLSDEYSSEKFKVLSRNIDSCVPAPLPDPPIPAPPTDIHLI
eukprot:450761-Ditylum_brightwellii.AAC.1